MSYATGDDAAGTGYGTGYAAAGTAYDAYGQQADAAQRTRRPWLPGQSGPPPQEHYDQPQYEPRHELRYEPQYEQPRYEQGGQPQYQAPPYQDPRHQAPPYEAPPYEEAGPGGARSGEARGAEASHSGEAPNGSATEGDYRTEQFSFVEEAADESEDVIDWLKFTESRTERREEARRRGRNRVVALVVALALVLAGGVGYLWYAGMLPGTGGDEDRAGTAAGAQRDVIVVHLRERGGASSTALLVDNESAARGTTVLLPNSLAVTTEDGTTTTLGRSVDDQGAGPTRDALNTLLGSDIKGTWRLDTPFLENLVELVGGIVLDTDVTVPGVKKDSAPLVERGSAQDLDGRAAVAYSTYRAPGETQDKQLHRFGQVMQAVLKKLSSDPQAATRTVESLGQIPDPSLSEGQLGTSLAKLAAHAKKGAYRTQVLPVQANGTLSERVSAQVVKKVLGGTVKNSDPDAAPRVSLKNATGKRTLDSAASVALVNGGYTVVKGGTGAARARSLVTYAGARQKAEAEQVAKTLGLPATAVREAAGAANADVTVLLGADYKG
nr:LCP family protein [Streptomyces albus]